jgi:hypothetical protein
MTVLKKRFWTLALLIFLASSMSVSGESPTPSQSGDYAGVEACVNCHDKLVKGWQKTRHANAIESLKKTNQQTLTGCVGCHVTGYGEMNGFIDMELTPELSNVQCEACHGPRKGHVEDPSKEGNPVTEEKCRTCHTPGQDSHFDYWRKVKLVHGD